jgi:hypothetical protein
MAIKVTLAKAHQSQLDDVEIKKELCSVEAELNKVELPFQKDTINFVFIKGMYLNSEKKMLTACLFVNKMDKLITELHGVLRLSFKNRKGQIAKTTVDFDEPFMGTLNPDEALLVHLGIPVKGLSEDENFMSSDISGNFEDVRVTMN